MTRFRRLLRRFPRLTALSCAAALRSLLGLVTVFPLVAALSALGVGSLTGGDRALFAPSALLLVETLRVGEVTLLAAAQSSLLLWSLCAMAQALPTALVFAAFAEEPRDPGVAFRLALARTPRFIALGALDYGLCALTFALGFVVWPAATSASGDAYYGFVVLLLGWAVLLSAAISVFVDLARSASLTPGVTLRQAVDAAALGFRERWQGLFSRYLLASGAGAFCVALAARVTELCSVDQPGGFRVALVFALHQLVLIALTGIQCVWVRLLPDN